MTQDPYRNFAGRYDWMLHDDPAREAFFRDLFAAYQVRSVLDCACGTGRDLLLFHALGCQVQGSDLSAAMLAQAEKRLAEANVSIPLRQADYRYLDEQVDAPFDGVVCLSNAINEPLEETDTLQALRSMRSVLRDGGILVLDQGQTDATMADPPRFAPMVNERDFSRLFVMNYTKQVMEVQVFDFLHTAEEQAFWHATFRFRIQLQDDWTRLLRQAGFATARFFGDWQATPYDKERSKRLIAVARK